MKLIGTLWVVRAFIKFGLAGTVKSIFDASIYLCRMTVNCKKDYDGYDYYAFHINYKP